MQEVNYTFAKIKRLSNKKNIETLFQHGEAFFVFPFRVVYLINKTTTTNNHIQILITVPKKKCKLATKRNRIKRLCRESFRLQQHIILPTLQSLNLHLQLMVSYTALNNLNFKEVYKAFEKILLKQKKIIETNN